MANDLDSDQLLQNLGPDLDPNSLTLFLKNILENIYQLFPCRRGDFCCLQIIFAKKIIRTDRMSDSVLKMIFWKKQCLF